MEHTVMVKEEAEDGRLVVTYTCSHRRQELNGTIQARSECGVSGQWSPVHLQCPPGERSSYLFGQETEKDFMIILISCILLVITSLTVAITSRIVFKRIISEEGGIFLRHRHHYEINQSEQQQQDFEQPKEDLKLDSKPTPKKVSLILKIENDEAKNSVHSAEPKLPGEKLAIDNTSSKPPPPGPARTRGVELTMMSTSTSSLPLPETSLTLHHCHALSRDKVQFATLSRVRSRRRNDDTVRHSRSFSSFQPVVAAVPTINMNKITD